MYEKETFGDEAVCDFHVSVKKVLESVREGENATLLTLPLAFTHKWRARREKKGEKALEGMVSDRKERERERERERKRLTLSLPFSLLSLPSLSF